jgi:hypothetical protein
MAYNLILLGSTDTYVGVPEAPNTQGPGELMCTMRR